MSILVKETLIACPPSLVPHASYSFNATSWIIHLNKSAICFLLGKYNFLDISKIAKNVEKFIYISIAFGNSSYPYTFATFPH